MNSANSLSADPIFRQALDVQSRGAYQPVGVIMRPKGKPEGANDEELLARINLISSVYSGVREAWFRSITTYITTGSQKHDPATSKGSTILASWINQMDSRIPGYSTPWLTHRAAANCFPKMIPQPENPPASLNALLTTLRTQVQAELLRLLPRTNEVSPLREKNVDGVAAWTGTNDLGHVVKEQAEQQNQVQNDSLQRFQSLLSAWNQFVLLSMETEALRPLVQNADEIHPKFLDAFVWAAQQEPLIGKWLVDLDRLMQCFRHETISENDFPELFAKITEYRIKIPAIDATMTSVDAYQPFLTNLYNSLVQILNSLVTRPMVTNALEGSESQKFFFSHAVTKTDRRLSFYKALLSSWMTLQLQMQRVSKGAHLLKEMSDVSCRASELYLKCLQMNATVQAVRQEQSPDAHSKRLTQTEEDARVLLAEWSALQALLNPLLERYTLVTEAWLSPDDTLPRLNLDDSDKTPYMVQQTEQTKRHNEIVAKSAAFLGRMKEWIESRLLSAQTELAALRKQLVEYQEMAARLQRNWASSSLTGALESGSAGSSLEQAMSQVATGLPARSPLASTTSSLNNSITSDYGFTVIDS